MNESSKLAVVIAAGGTAGHVRPALAVGEALRARGATVTFAGSPDRVESRLVPEAGFELDTFAISGLPRTPSLELLRALWRAAKAPFACRAILRRRRPDVVLGGGGYVAGPMVLAARLSGIPAALTEADAHLGLANRLAAPFASVSVSAAGIPLRPGPPRPSGGRSRRRRGRRRDASVAGWRGRRTAPGRPQERSNELDRLAPQACERVELEDRLQGPSHNSTHAGCRRSVTLAPRARGAGFRHCERGPERDPPPAAICELRRLGHSAGDVKEHGASIRSATSRRRTKGSDPVSGRCRGQRLTTAWPHARS